MPGTIWILFAFFSDINDLIILGPFDNEALAVARARELRNEPDGPFSVSACWEFALQVWDINGYKQIGAGRIIKTEELLP